MEDPREPDQARERFSTSAIMKRRPLGVVAFLLAMSFASRSAEPGHRPSLRVLWDRFPKFVLGFVIAHFFLFCNVVRMARRLELLWVDTVPLGGVPHPHRQPGARLLFVRPELKSYDTDSSQGDLYKVEVAHSVVVGNGLRGTMGIDYRYEDYTVSETDQGVTNELVPHISWAKTSADDPIYTRDGYRLKFSVQGALEA